MKLSWILRHTTNVWALFLTVALLATPSVAHDIATGSSADLVPDRGKRHFVIASSNNFPPVNQLDEQGHLVGFGRDISDAVIEAVGGTQAHIHSAIWSDVLKWLAEGKADFIHDTGYSEERTAYLDYSDPILIMQEEIFVRVDRFDITNLDSLKNQKVACVNKHVTHLYLKTVPGIECLVVGTPIEGLYALLNGDVAAFVFPRQILLHIAQRLNLINRLKVAGDPIRELAWHMTVRKGDQEMLGLLNQGIAAIKESGEYSDIYDHWFGRTQTLGYSSKEMTIIVAGVATLSLTVGILMVLAFRVIRVVRVQKNLAKSLEDQTKIAAALQESEQRFKDFSNVASDWFWETNENNVFTYFSDHFEPVTGIRTDHLLGKTREETRPDSIDDEAWNSLMEHMTAHRDFRNVAFSRLRPDGEEVWISISGMPRFDSSRNFLGYRGTGTEITEEVKTSLENQRIQEQLVQSSKLASLGEMATGVAHEINQPLNIIRMAAETLTELMREGEIPSSDLLTTRLERIVSQTGRAAGIIDRMRVFGRSPLEHATEISPKDAVLGAVGLLNEQLRLSEIELTLDIPETCPAVMGDLIQLEQVILNLLSNARDAIQESEKDKGQTNRVTVKIKNDPATNVVRVIIEDTGGGIPEDILPKIFDPFLTTKEVGKGTGLGLSISYGIINEIGGSIDAVNIEGGARFTITLPLAEASAK